MKKQVHFYLHDSTIKQLDKFASDFGFSRSTALGFVVIEYFKDKPQYQIEPLNEPTEM